MKRKGAVQQRRSFLFGSRSYSGYFTVRKMKSVWEWNVWPGRNTVEVNFG